MRAALFLLSLLIALAGGVYLSRFINPIWPIWSIWFSPDLHRPLDEIADEVVSSTQFSQSINRNLEGTHTYYQSYAKNLDVKQKAQILAIFEENEESLRKEMRTQMRQFLIQSLSREELIEIKNFYKTRAGHQFNKLINSPNEHAIYSIAFTRMNKELARIRESSSVPAPPPVSDKQSK